MSTLADRVQWLVNQRHPSVNDAAKAWHMPQATLQRIVTGTTPSPRLATLYEIVEGTGVTFDWLLNGVGPAPVMTPAERLRAELRELPKAELIERLVKVSLGP